ncbi:MAG: T9SS type A sorting domain-containing protein [Bacteroidetes bacterium]|nr:T9SS type A sorting domain-containing protein [Bacteroidota bacterium]
MKRKIHFLSILLFSLYSNIGFAQITFQEKIVGTSSAEECNSVQLTSNGGYIFVGMTRSYGAGDNDIYLVKINSNGDTAWTRTIGGIGEEDGYSVQQTSDSGFIVSGTTNSFGAGSNDVFIVKVDTNANVLWTKTIGGTNYDFCNSIQQTIDGGYIATGGTSSFGAGGKDVYFIKMDSNGDTVWTKTYGGINDDWGNVVQQTRDSGFIIVGTFGSDGFSIGDIYLIKTNKYGDTTWTKSFGGAGYNLGSSVQQTTDNGYIIVGYAGSFGVGSGDIYLIKTDSFGNLLWSKTIGEANYTNNGSCVFQTNNSGYIFLSNQTLNIIGAQIDVSLIKVDSVGDILWKKTFGGSDSEHGNSFQQTNDGGYIIAATTSDFGTSYDDFYLIKTDSSGNSGCNEINATTITTIPPTQVASPLIIISSGGITTTPTPLVGSGGIITLLCSNVGINEIASDISFYIFPNPSVNNFTVSFERMIMKGNIEILTALGESVFKEIILNEMSKEISLKDISGGVYCVKVCDGEKYYTKKLIIQ